MICSALYAGMDGVRCRRLFRTLRRVYAHNSDAAADNGVDSASQCLTSTSAADDHTDLQNGWQIHGTGVEDLKLHSADGNPAEDGRVWLLRRTAGDKDRTAGNADGLRLSSRGTHSATSLKSVI